VKFSQKAHLFGIIEILNQALKRIDPLLKSGAPNQRDQDQNKDKKRGSELSKDNTSLIAVEVAPNEFDGFPIIRQSPTPLDLSSITSRKPSRRQPQQ
jgi:hypothetical protein